MKVLLFNGSPKKEGCTYTALSEIAATLDSEGVDSEIIWLGKGPISGCLACGYCVKNKKCVQDDFVNEAAERCTEADGFVFGSPVHFAGAGGSITCFMDRLFYSGRPSLQMKPGAAIISCRRSGSTAAFDQLNKYFTISQMPVVSSQYWNAVHGNSPEEVRQDLEGMQVMRTLARNMAWLLKCIEAGRRAGVPLPEVEQRQATNFIR